MAVISSQLITMAPGVSNQTNQDEAKVGVAGSAKSAVNGGRVEYNTFEVDGSDVLNTSINASRGQGRAADGLSQHRCDPGDEGSDRRTIALFTERALRQCAGHDQIRRTSVSWQSLPASSATEMFNARNYFDPIFTGTKRTE